METAETTLDDILTQVASALNDSTESPPVADVTSDPNNSTIPETDSVNGEKLLQLRERLATEIEYLRIIPPLTQDVLAQFDAAFFNLIKKILKLADRPYQAAQIKEQIDIILSNSAREGGRDVRPPPINPCPDHFPFPSTPFLSSNSFGDTNRTDTNGSDEELVFIAEKLRKEVMGDERAIPLVVGLFYIAGGTAAGATVGYHLGKIAKKIVD